MSGAGKSCDLTKFIEYAVVGLLDGLEGVLAKAQGYLLAACWRNYAYARIDAVPHITKPTRKRYVALLTRLQLFTEYAISEIPKAAPELAAAYAKFSEGAVSRDVKRLASLDMLTVNGGRVKLNASVLPASLPQQRTFAK